MFAESLLSEIRARFCHVERCPYQGARVFFENAGGSLTLKSVVDISAQLAAIPDNQGRDNPASQHMGELIARGRRDMFAFLNASDGAVFVGESGTECLFRIIRAATLAAAPGGNVVGSTLEHPATASAAQQWSAHAGKTYTAIAHNPEQGAVDIDAYRSKVNADTRVATIIQTSPVTGIAVDVGAIALMIREIAPACFIIVDGIQHAPHGAVHLDDYAIDGYAVSGYKVFSRHNYGFAWVSPRLSRAPHDKLNGTADDHWELGTRDAGAYATFSEVVNYLQWLGQQANPQAADARAKLTAATAAIKAHEQALCKLMLHGNRQQRGLGAMPRVLVIGGVDNTAREGLVSLAVRDAPSAEVVAALSARGVRVHIRKNDYFSANILKPLQLDSCVRVSMCHYNSADEVLQFLRAMDEIAGGD